MGGTMKQLTAFICGVAVMVIGFKQPWLNLEAGGGYAKMGGDGKWSSLQHFQDLPEGLPLLWVVVIGGAFIMFGVMTDRPGRTLFGAAVAGGAAGFAMWAPETVSGVPKKDLIFVMLQVDTAPKAILAAAVIAGVAASMTPVPTGQQHTPVEVDSA